MSPKTRWPPGPLKMTKVQMASYQPRITCLIEPHSSSERPGVCLGVIDGPDGSLQTVLLLSLALLPQTPEGM